MPRQLKVIASNVTPNAPFRVNWTTPVIVKPGNKITMDKFVGVIPDITQNFVLPESTFTVYLDTNGIEDKSVNVTIPGERYATIASLLETMTNAANDAFSGYVPNMLPLGLDGNYDWYRDAGLKMQFSSVDQKLFFQYTTAIKGLNSQSPYAMTDTIDLSAIGAAADVDNFFIPTAGNVLIRQIATNAVLLKGGGVLARLEFRLPPAAEAIADDITTVIGFSNEAEYFRGIGQTPDGTVNLQYKILGDESLVTIPAAWIDSLNVLTMDFYQFNGFFQIRIYDAEANPNISFFDSSRDGFETALGPIDYRANYNFLAQVFKDSFVHPFPKIKNFIEFTKDRLYDSAPSSISYRRTMALDFTQSSELRAGLGVPSGLLLCTPQNTSVANYTGPNNINMALINNLFDIALEIIDIPLETYQADDSGFPGSRKNIVAYFRPELTQVGSNTYRFDVNIFDWLDIPITYDLNLTSCSFRLLNPSNNADLLFASCSFNLLINDKEY